MKANLHIVVYGVRGNAPKFHEKAQCVCYPEGIMGYSKYISIDAFEGRGDTYKRREGDCLIEVNNGLEGVFSGSFDELVELIKKGKEFK